MKTIKPSAIFKYNGELHEVIGTSDGKVIYHRKVGAEPCLRCGHIYEYSDVEISPNFQERSEAVETLVNQS